MRSSPLTSWIAALALALSSVACGQSDAGITTAVKTKLVADDVVKAYQIDVDTERKAVTLTGTVDNALAKSRAVELTRNTDGVTRVIDNIVVSASASAAPTMPDVRQAAFSDPVITASVKSKLLGDPTVGGLKIDVDTRDGTVTLAGQVKSQAERDQALKLARETDGVKSVEDKLTVVP